MPDKIDQEEDKAVKGAEEEIEEGTNLILEQKRIDYNIKLFEELEGLMKDPLKKNEFIKRINSVLKDYDRNPIANNFYAAFVLKYSHSSSLKDKVYSRLVKIENHHKNDQFTLYNLGMYSLEFKLYEEAQNYFQRLEDIDKDNIDFLFNQVYCLEKMGQENILNAYAELMSKDKSYSPAYLKEAFLLSKNGDPQTSRIAKALLEKLLDSRLQDKKAPSLQAMSNILSSLILAKADKEEFVQEERKYEKQLKEQRTKDELYTYQEAQGLQLKQQDQLALNLYKKLWKEGSNKKIVLLSGINLGKLLEKTEKYPEALEVYKKIFSDFGRSMPISEVEEKIMGLKSKLGIEDKGPNIDEDSFDYKEEEDLSAEEDGLCLEIFKDGEADGDDSMIKQEDNAAAEEAKEADDNIVESEDLGQDDIEEKDHVPELERQPPQKKVVLPTQDELDKEYDIVVDQFIDEMNEEVLDYSEALFKFRRKVGNFWGSINVEHQRQHSMNFSADGNSDADVMSNSSLANSMNALPIEEYHEMIKNDPNNYKAHYGLAFYEIQPRHYTDKLLYHLEMTHKLKPKYHEDEVTSLLAEIYFDRKMYEEALKHYKLNLLCTDNLFHCYYRIGFCYKKIGNIDASVMYLKMAGLENEKNTETLFQLAKLNYKTRNLDISENYLKMCLKIDPNNSNALYLLGRMVLEDERSNLEKATSFLQRGLKDHALTKKREQKIYLMLSKVKEQEDLYKEAMEYLLKANRTMPSRKINEEQARLSIRMGDLKKAIDIFKEILKENKTEPHLYLEIGTLFALNSNFVKAKKYLLQCLILDKDNAMANLRLGKIEYNHFRNKKKAIKYFNKIGPEDIYHNFKAEYQLGYVEWKSGHLEEAIERFRESIRMNPKFIDGWNAIGDVMLQQGKFEIAASYFKRAINIDSENVQSLLGYGKCKIKSNQIDFAYTEFLSAEASDENNNEVQLYLGHCLNAQKNYREAIEKYNKCLERGYKEDIVLSGLGNAYTNMKDYKKGALTYEKLKSINSENLTSRKNLAACYMMLGQVEKALEEYNFCLSRQKNDEAVKIDIANVKIHIKDYISAKKILFDVIEQNPSNSKAFFTLGKTFELMQVYQNSLDHYHKANELDLENEKYKKAVERVNLKMRKVQ